MGKIELTKDVDKFVQVMLLENLIVKYHLNRYYYLQCRYEYIYKYLR
jgi:hypothetical protein